MALKNKIPFKQNIRNAVYAVSRRRGDRTDTIWMVYISFGELVRVHLRRDRMCDCQTFMLLT